MNRLCNDGAGRLGEDDIGVDGGAVARDAGEELSEGARRDLALPGLGGNDVED